MENIIFTVIGLVLGVLGLSLYNRKAADNVQVEVKKEHAKIDNMDNVSLINLANSILARRSNTDR
jgi:uncharacterized membrane-anchored protein YhcB (DUF1043 family)